MGMIEHSRNSGGQMQGPKASAEALMRLMVEARASASRGLRTLRRPELLREETPEGDHLEAAIDGTKRMASAFDELMGRLVGGLSPEDLALIEEIRIGEAARERAWPSLRTVGPLARAA